MPPLKPYILFKSLIDRFLAFFLLLSLLPLLLLLSILVLLFLGKPIFFCQIRPGFNSRLFRLYKFRSMSTQYDESGQLLPDSMRLSVFGRLLRSSSLDELPSLVNILRGEMSFVGPRPLLVEYLPLYTELQATRHRVLPGLTGFAQVNGRNLSTWDQRLDYDVFYVQNISFKLDLFVLIKSIFVVLSRTGVSEHGSFTKSRFQGSTSNRNR